MAELRPRAAATRIGRADSKMLASEAPADLISGVKKHIINMTMDMKTSGLPFEDAQNVWSGMSGCLYALPMLCTPYNWERFLWLLQAFLSVSADYFYVNDLHIVHGLDRIFATYNTIRMILLVGSNLPIWTVSFALLPLAMYYNGALAKKTNRVDRWIFFHTLWHLFGGVLCAFFTYMLRYVYHVGDPAYS